MGRVQGKVAFITGAARGQGRSHAVRLAEEGADIIAVDLCRDFETVGYPMATPDDLKETARLVERLDRRVVAVEADVRDRSQLQAAIERGIGELGGLDIVVAQAGIAGMKGEPQLRAWTDVVDTNLLGTINAVHAALPHLSAGASIIATGSTARSWCSPRATESTWSGRSRPPGDAAAPPARPGPSAPPPGSAC
jgi:NAD(P)-dependent dehydrogenase (short-subunit alcohol dehydrogenase family)